MRLKKQTREDIIDSIHKEKIQFKIKRIKEEINNIAQGLADKFYPESIKEWMKKAPNGAFHSIDRVKISIGKANFGHDVFRGTRYNPSFVATLIRPIKVLARDMYISALEAGIEDKQRLQELSKQLDVLMEEERVLRATVNAALNSCNTQEQLIKNYPILAKYLKPISSNCTALTITNADVEKVLNEVSQ